MGPLHLGLLVLALFVHSVHQCERAVYAMNELGVRLRCMVTLVALVDGRLRWRCRRATILVLEDEADHLR